jgi:hypothetical protein
MSEEKFTPARSNESGEIPGGLHEWRQGHPKATMAEIEELSQEPPAEAELPHCPACGSLMQRRLWSCLKNHPYSP